MSEPTKEAANVGRCTQRESKQIFIHGIKPFSNRCLLDEEHQGRHNYQKPMKDDEIMLRRFLNNRSERGMM